MGEADRLMEGDIVKGEKGEEETRGLPLFLVVPPLARLFWNKRLEPCKFVDV
ncbi:hypothetical protein [Cohnella sp.]|uniref:hypothetical protein n=1 Tax=Cohnella sp. TaxID=1883426 RepID=UPI00356B2B67